MRRGLAERHSRQAQGFHEARLRCDLGWVPTSPIVLFRQSEFTFLYVRCFRVMLSIFVNLVLTWFPFFDLVDVSGHPSFFVQKQPVYCQGLAGFFVEKGPRTEWGGYGYLLDCFKGRKTCVCHPGMQKGSAYFGVKQKLRHAGVPSAIHQQNGDFCLWLLGRYFQIEASCKTVSHKILGAIARTTGSWERQPYKFLNLFGM